MIQQNHNPPENEVVGPSLMNISLKIPLEFEKLNGIYQLQQKDLIKELEFVVKHYILDTLEELIL